MIIQLVFTDGSSASKIYKESEPFFNSEMNEKIVIINNLLDKHNKTWNDVDCIKEMKERK